MCKMIDLYADKIKGQFSFFDRKRSITSTLTNVRPLTWPVVPVSPASESYPAVSVTMGANLPEMNGQFDPDILEAQ